MMKLPILLGVTLVSLDARKPVTAIVAFERVVMMAAKKSVWPGW